MKRAVLLLSMGGPSSLREVQPFLFNLFSDPAILRVPSWIRLPLAWMLSFYRKKEAEKIYSKIGGSSPLTENTQAQARALEDELKTQDKNQNKVFVGMLYAKPFVAEAVNQIAEFCPDEIIILPLYPQHSTTTTAPAILLAQEEIKKININAEIKTINSFPTLDGLISAWVSSIRGAQSETDFSEKKKKILFSAHGLPEQIVRGGDPYPQECKKTAEAIARRLNLDDQDWCLCYQSRVGPVRWIGPSSESEIDRACAQGLGIIIAPIAFVSEHSETLYEIEQLYRARAKKNGCTAFAVAQTPGTDPLFIKDLARTILAC